jgi:tetratricopeptide (TPR) repeat protein
MQERYYPLSYVDSVGSLYGIGNILAQQGNYNKALDYYQRVLKLQEQYYPSGHVDIAHCLNNIGMCYENQNNFKTALDYHQRALNIYEEFLPIGHLDRVMASTIVVDSLEKYERMQ